MEYTDNSVCIDDDCPLPEHTGQCPENITLEMWRDEAKRCRRMIGLLIRRIKYLDETVATYRVMAKGQRNVIGTAKPGLAVDTYGSEDRTGGVEG